MQRDNLPKATAIDTYAATVAPIMLSVSQFLNKFTSVSKETKAAVRDMAKLTEPETWESITSKKQKIREFSENVQEAFVKIQELQQFIKNSNVTITAEEKAQIGEAIAKVFVAFEEFSASDEYKKLDKETQNDYKENYSQFMKQAIYANGILNFAKDETSIKVLKLQLKDFLGDYSLSENLAMHGMHQKPPENKQEQGKEKKNGNDQDPPPASCCKIL